MGSKLGVLKVAARRLGIPFEEYMQKINSGLKYCWKCQSWKPVDDFGNDATRGDGKAAKCYECAYDRTTENGPGMRDRRRMMAKGLSWCRGCQTWLPSSTVHQGACRECLNRESRERYSRDAEHRMSRKARKAARRSVEPVPETAKESLLDLFHNKCAYCGGPAETWDHIVPISKGGETVPWNIVPACLSCNSSKKDRDVFDWMELEYLL